VVYVDDATTVANRLDAGGKNLNSDHREIVHNIILFCDGPPAEVNFVLSGEFNSVRRSGRHAPLLGPTK